MHRIIIEGDLWKQIFVMGIRCCRGEVNNTATRKKKPKFNKQFGEELTLAREAKNLQSQLPELPAKPQQEGGDEEEEEEEEEELFNQVRRLVA